MADRVSGGAPRPRVASPSNRSAASAPTPASRSKSPPPAQLPSTSWSEKVGSAGKPSAKGSTGLADFASYYPASKKAPQLPAGQPTVDTFTEPQMRALHRAYWSAPASASLGEMVALALEDKAFAGRKDEVGDRQVGRLIAKYPDSFPWGWRSRALAATTHRFVDALVRAPQGTAVSQVIKDLTAADPAFPTLEAFKNASRGVWVEEPERFPFLAKALDKGPSGYKMEARGEAPDIRTDHQGRLVLNEALAAKVVEIGLSPAIRHDSTLEDFLELVADQVDGPFTKSTFVHIQERFPKLVPSFLEMRAEGTRRMCELIRDLYASGTTSADQIIATLHTEHGYPMWKSTMMTYLRNLHPDLVPEFKANREEASYAEARKLLDAIKASPDKTYTQVGLDMGLPKQRVRELTTLIHRRWEDELPTQYAAPSYTLADKKLIQRALDDAPLNASVSDVMRVLETLSPEFFEAHPFTSAPSFYSSIRGLMGFDSFRQLQRDRFADAFADVVKRSPRGSTLVDIVDHLQDEHEGAYSRSNVVKMIDDWKAHPKKYPQITKLADKDGVFPWERSKVTNTTALAKRVGAAITANPGATLRQVVNELHKDKDFTHQYPTFAIRHIHELRGKYPKLVPFVDDLKVHGDKARKQAAHAEYDRIAQRIVKAAGQHDDQSGLTVAMLARELELEPHRVLSTIRRNPALFPWYRARPAGEVDLYLATRVAHDMDKAPLGTTLSDVLKGLKADPAVAARYPSLNYHTFAQLRERYPELVPHWFNRDAILRSKLITDALLSAKKGTPFKDVIASLEKQHPGQFRGRWAEPGYVKAIWASNPALVPFTQALGKTPRLEGHGHPKVLDTETPGELATRLSKLERITEKLPLLDALGDRLHKEYFADYEFIAIQHLLGPQVALFETMRDKGMKPGRTTIVGIPYSVSEPVAATLEDKGWDVRVPPLDLEHWYLDVKKAMEERIASSKESGRKIVVIDDGGLAAMMFDKYPALAKEAHRFRIVEQTTRGITVADGVKLSSPVVNVAQSWGKFVEGPMIGDVVAEKLVSRLAGIDVKSLKGKHVGVIGAGTIGLPLAEYLRGLGAVVTVRDAGESGRKLAKDAGFAVETDAKKFFGKQDIIIGATGHQSMTAEDLGHLRSGTIIGSASSKLVEIDVDALASGAKKKGGFEVIDSQTFPPTVRYTLKDGRTVDLIARGFPLNFDGDVESVASEKIQLTMGLLMIGAAQAANIDAAGVRRLDPKAQLALLDAFEQVGGLDVSGAEVAEAMALAKARLTEMSKKHGVADRRHGHVS